MKRIEIKPDVILKIGVHNITVEVMTVEKVCETLNLTFESGFPPLHVKQINRTRSGL